MPTLLSAHREHLERFRGSMNLVGPGPLDPHYDDCAQAVQIVEPSGRWADLGAGAGFPGIVFAATFPDVALDLVDSRRKRCVFLEQVLAAAGVDHVRVLCTRIEDLEPGYDGVMARALAPPRQVLAHASRLLVPGGLLLLMLSGEQEVPEGPGWERVRTLDYRVGDRSRRAVLLANHAATTFTAAGVTPGSRPS